MSYPTTMDETAETLARFRPDIEWVLYAKQSKWVAHDPISNGFFYFSQIEHAATQLLDGICTADEILVRLRTNFPESEVSKPWLSSFILKLRMACLVSPNGRTSTQDLVRVSATERTNVFQQIIRNPLSIRVPLFDPSRLLESMKLPAHILFNPILVAIGIAAFLVCNFFVLNQILVSPEQVVRRLVQAPVQFWFAILVVYLSVKLLHELGHALACVHWKVSCREIGLLFLFFTPCIYCETTDSWRLPSKWHRAAIAAAGIYVELWIAVFAALIWLNTNHNDEGTIAASVMLMCTLGTIAVNANPCFKYDGYYILSDIWGVPNLSQQSSSALWHVLVAMLGGKSLPAQEFDRNVLLLALYSLVSSVYRFVVLSLLLWFVWSVLAPKGVGFVAILIVATTIFGLARNALQFFGWVFTEHFAPKPIKAWRSFVFLSGIVGILVFAFAIPLPNYVRSRGVLDFQDKMALFAPHDSTLVVTAKPNSHLQKGDSVIEFCSPTKELEMLELVNEISQLERRYDLLKQSSINEPTAAFEIPTLIELLKELSSKRSVLQLELELLFVKAPTDGYFLPSELKSQPPLTPPMDSIFVNRVSHESNHGCAMERGSLMGWITSKEKVSFQTLLPESELKFLRIGMPAECILDSHISHVVKGRITRISADPIKEVTPENYGDSWVVLERNELGKLHPILPHYQVTLEVVDGLPSAIKGANATIRFKTESLTLFERFSRYIRTTFRMNY